MNEVKSLILSSTLDYSTDLICAELEKRNISYLRINRDQFNLMKINFDVNLISLKIIINNQEYIFNNCITNSIYFRAPVFSRTYNKKYTLEEQVYKSQWGAFIRNLICFDKVFWMNNPVNTYRAENKLYQLQKAKEIGLMIPETIVANYKPENLHFDNCIIKSIDTALFCENDTEMFTYSSVVSKHDLNNDILSLAPVFIQEYINPKIDIRATYVNGKIFPVEINDANMEISDDWRCHKKENLNYIPTDIPDEIKRRLQVLMKILGLNFGGIDLIKNDDKYYFIEVNPTGEWGWIVKNTDFKIDKEIVNYLA